MSTSLRKRKKMMMKIRSMLWSFDPVQVTHPVVE
jgi:hypothetical protein